jgi:hypothetical protein
MGNLNCCKLTKMSIFIREKNVFEEADSHAYHIKIIKIQSFLRAVNYRIRFKIRNMNKNLRVLTRNLSRLSRTQDGFNQSKIPGKIISIDSIKVDETVALIEESLGDFVIEENELIKYIEEHKHMLKNFSIEYDDGSIYYGYYNKEWEREGYGILIYPDGSKHQGFFKNNKMNGRGRLVGAQGGYYEGIINLCR